jgi:hypothetical protein
MTRLETKRLPGHHSVSKRVTSMKSLVSMFALALALAFTGPAFAEDVTKATNAADCEKAGGMWGASTNKCGDKKGKTEDSDPSD